MPKLAKDAAVTLVDGVCHLPPALDLVIPPKAWTVDDALALLGDSGAFGYNEARRCALVVVLAHQGRRYVILRRESASSLTSKCDWEAQGPGDPSA